MGVGNFGCFRRLGGRVPENFERQRGGIIVVQPSTQADCADKYVFWGDRDIMSPDVAHNRPSTALSPNRGCASSDALKNCLYQGNGQAILDRDGIGGQVESVSITPARPTSRMAPKITAATIITYLF
jgi:hypothetical protein